MTHNKRSIEDHANYVCFSDPRSKKRMSPPVTTSPIETTGSVSNAGIVKDAPSLNVENVHATPLDQSTAGNALSAEQLVREAERLLRGPSATAGGTRIALSGDVHAGFAPASHKRKPDRVNLRLLNSLQCKYFIYKVSF